MSNIGKVQEWVVKAVSQIAAFDGKTRKIDTDAEKRALSELLSGQSVNLPDLNDDDIKYIEGFMLDKNKKAEKIKDNKKENSNNTVEINLEKDGKFADLRTLPDKVELLFNKDGSLSKTEIKDKDGSTLYCSDVEYRKNGEKVVKYKYEDKDKNVFEGEIVYNNAENSSKKFLYINNTKVLTEVHHKDGMYSKITHPNPVIMEPEQRAEYEKYGAVLSIVLETITPNTNIYEREVRDDVGVLYREQKDADGNIIETQTYEYYSNGNIASCTIKDSMGRPTLYIEYNNAKREQIKKRIVYEYNNGEVTKTVTDDKGNVIED